jgi:molecular chaperone GrpE (heat shock protein)
MSKEKLSHDILTMLERLRIMHDLAKDQNFSVIGKEELLQDLEMTLNTLEKNFKELIQ